MRFTSTEQNTGTAVVQCLATEQMVEVAEVIQGSFQHVMGNYVGETHLFLSRWVAEWILTKKAYLVVTPEGLQDVITEVFQKREVTDFVFTLLHNFGSRWGMPPDRFSSLCANLAIAAVPKTAYAISSVPKAIADRLATSVEDAYSLLQANPWLVVLLLLQLFVRVQPPKV